MSRLLIIILFFMTLVSFDTNNSEDDFKFGIKYNPIRLKFGIPCINKDMNRQDGYGSFVVYSINIEPSNKPYHFSKAIVAFDNDKIYQEKDTYRQNIDDSTIKQLDMDIFYDWTNNAIIVQGSVGKLDKRKFGIKSEDYLKSTPPLRLPSYKWEVLDLSQIDELLKIWQLSRFGSE